MTPSTWGCDSWRAIFKDAYKLKDINYAHARYYKHYGYLFPRDSDDTVTTIDFVEKMDDCGFYYCGNCLYASVSLPEMKSHVLEHEGRYAVYKLSQTTPHYGQLEKLKDIATKNNLVSSVREGGSKGRTLKNISRDFFNELADKYARHLGLSPEEILCEKEHANFETRSPYDALSDIIERLEALSEQTQEKQRKTDTLLKKAEELSERLRTTQDVIVNRVGVLVQQNKNEIEVEFIRDRDDALNISKKVCDEALLRVQEECEGKYTFDWKNLLERATTMLTNEMRNNERQATMEGRQKKLSKQNLTHAAIQQTRVELDDIVCKLKEARLEAGKKSREARRHAITIEEMIDLDATDEQIEPIKVDFENARHAQKEAEERAERLRVQLIGKSRAQDSLPEYELKALVPTRKNGF